MKTKLILLITFSILLQFCSDPNINESIDDKSKRNENWCWFVNGETGEGYWIEVGDKNNTPDGNFTLFYANGDISVIGSTCNNEPCDSMFVFSFNNELVMTRIVMQDTIVEIWEDGNLTVYNPDLTVFREVHYENNNAVGIQREYHQNGILKNQQFYTDSENVYKAFYSSGFKKSSGTLIDDAAEGKFEKWFESGQIHIKSHYSNGKCDGEYKIYHENGQLKMKGIYQRGNREGYFRYYHKNGNDQSIEHYKNGKLEGVSEYYYDTGIKRTIQSYSKGISNGTYIYYYPNGQIETDGITLNGELENYIKYNEDGSILEDKRK